jgi:hypothetical protein
LLFIHMAEQSERAAAHIAISQLPRVEERLMAMMWLLAERWGYVTEAGTVVPLALTHETLGELIGSRRPTVTLALGKLTQRGALGKDDRGWLIVGSPPESHGAISEPGTPELLEGPLPNRQVRSGATAVKASHTPARESSSTAHPSGRSETKSRLPSSFYGPRSAASAGVIFDSGSTATLRARAADDHVTLNIRKPAITTFQRAGVTSPGASTGRVPCVS